MKFFTLALIVAALGLVACSNTFNAASAAPSACTTGHDHLHTSKDHRWTLNLVRSYSIPKWAFKKHRHLIKCAAGPGHRAAMKNQWRKVRRSVLPPNHDLWVTIGRCEQPGDGYMGINWAETGPTYQGGLGFFSSSWDGYKPAGYPDNAGHATWRQQMKVANILYRAYGTSPWGCA